MEQIKEMAKQAVSELQTRSSSPPCKADSLAPSTIRRGENGEMSISLYADGLATREEIAFGTAKLRAAFPKMESGFWSVLVERIVANNFSRDRMRQAIEYVLDNFQYKELNVADVIRFDKRIRLYTWNEVYRLMGQFPHPDFESRDIEGVKYWVLKADLLNQNL